MQVINLFLFKIIYIVLRDDNELGLLQALEKTWSWLQNFRAVNLDPSSALSFN